jgi:hypothetical protein
LLAGFINAKRKNESRYYSLVETNFLEATATTAKVVSIEKETRFIRYVN